MLSLLFVVYTGATGQACGQLLPTNVLLKCGSSEEINWNTHTSFPRTINQILIPFYFFAFYFLNLPILLGNRVNASCLIQVISQVKCFRVHKAQWEHFFLPKHKLSSELFSTLKYNLSQLAT